jgi:hypothetical protein
MDTNIQETLPAVVEPQLPVLPLDINDQAMVRAVGMGDVSGLSPEQRLRYIGWICQSTGLNAATLPIRILEMDGRTVLYATAEAGAQLRNNRKVSITITERREERGCYIVVARASMPSGRTDEATGAVPTIYPDTFYDRTSRMRKPHPRAGKPIDGLDYCNALKKAETQAKRRAALSICGLSFPDESEVEEMKRANVTSVVDTTETASERGAALLDVTVEPQESSTPTAAVPQSAPPGNAAPNPPELKAGATPVVGPEPAPANSTPPGTPEPAQSSTAGPASVLSDGTVGKLETIFGAAKVPTDCGAFLISRSYLAAGANLNALKPDMATKIIGNARAFHRSVEAWAAAKNV